MAAAARPEPIRSGFEPGLPLGFQRVFDPGLVAPVSYRGNSERAHFCLVTGFRYVHPPDGRRHMRTGAGVHAHRHLGPGLAGHRDLPVDSRCPAARAALRHLPHANQRVAPAPQRELLQVPGRRPVTLLRRLEDPAAQPPYLLLVVPPVHTLPGVTIERVQALRSVHRGAQRALRFRHLRSLRFKGSPAHVSALSSPGSKTWHPGQLYEDHPGGVPGHGPAVPVFLLPFGCPASALWTPCPATGIQPPLRSAYRTACAYPRLRCGPIAGFTRSARMRPGPGRAPSIPRGRRCPPAATPLRPSPAASQQRSLPSRKSRPARDVSVTRHQQGFPVSRPIPVLPLACGRHGWDGGPWAFP